MPLTKAKLAKMPSTKSSILNYFAKNEATEQKQSSSSHCSNRNNNTHCKKRIQLKRKTKDSLLHEMPKKLGNYVNIEPIIISSSDESDSEHFRSTTDRKNCKKLRTAKEKENVEFCCSTENSLKSIHKNAIISQCESTIVKESRPVKKVTESQANLQSLVITPMVSSAITDSARPLETDIIDQLEDDSLEENDSGKIAYYHLNFCEVLDTVLDNDDDRALFDNSDDMDWIDKFKALPLSAQKLYVRLYHRKLAWLRMEQVQYPNIARDIHKVMEHLTKCGFLMSIGEDGSSELELEQVLKLLPAPNLKDIAKSFKVSITGLQKKQIRNELCKMCRKQRSIISGFISKEVGPGKVGLEGNVMKRALRSLGPCYRVATGPRKVFNRVLLVFDVTRGIDDESDCTLTGSKNATRQGRHLQLSAIVMAGMGKVCYPQFKINRATSIFNRRVDLLHYETAFQFQMDVMSCVESGQWEDASLLCENANTVWMDIKKNDPDSVEYAENLPEFLRTFTAMWVYMRLRSLEVEILQRLKRYAKAVAILKELLDQKTFCVSKRGHWWERLALNVDQHLKEPVTSMNIIHQSLTDSQVRVGHKLALAERANKILASKAVKSSPQLNKIYAENLKPVIDGLCILEAPVVEITGCLLPAEIQSGRSRFITEVSEENGSSSLSATMLCSVEELALSHYKSIGYPSGIHGEGGTFTTLLCVFLWDIIFMDGIPDVFRTNYQTHPLDYHTDGFYITRKEVIEERLHEISCLSDKDFNIGDLEFSDKSDTYVIDLFTTTWDMEYGKACSGMDWERFSTLEEALGLVKCIGGKVLAGIFRRLCKDLRHTRSGLPDLAVWNPIKKIYKLVEVKGPGDRLSTNQKLWIDELIALGANIEVCKVIAIGGKKLS